MESPDAEALFPTPDTLIPAIVVDAITGQVLMLGYMNRLAYQKTLQTRYVTFFSRSRQKLWTKGETSGNFLYLVDIQVDCDQDALRVLVLPAGPVCHTGTYSCFGDTHPIPSGILGKLEERIHERKYQQAPASSYTASLLHKGIPAIGRKVVEEAVETLLAGLSESRERLMEESADLMYHLLVLLSARNVSFSEVLNVLARRYGWVRQGNFFPKESTFPPSGSTTETKSGTK